MKTVKDYHDLCLKCIILLFVDIFEKFRNNSLKNCGLCRSHYLSALAGLPCWDAMLNIARVELEKTCQTLTCIRSLKKI